MATMIDGLGRTAYMTIMLAGSGRIRLLQQALSSYAATTEKPDVRNSTELVVVMDREEVYRPVCALLSSLSIPHFLLYLPDYKGKLGKLRNIAAESSIKLFSPQCLHFVDDDVYFRKGWWNELYLPIYMYGSRVGIIGGDRHPYHLPKSQLTPCGASAMTDGLEQTDAVAGYSMFMRTSTFVDLGGFPEDGNGVGASEDWAFCQKARQRGKIVGYAVSRPVLHCGLTNSNGQPATGADEILRNKPVDEDVKGVIYE